MVRDKSILIFGAGKIGRSFIGQLFAQSGYKLIFADVDQSIINELNKRNSYVVVHKGISEETILVNDVRAVSGYDTGVLIKEIANASIMAVSVGKNALGKIIPVVAEGLKLRQELTPGKPLDIIIAENMRSAGEYIRSQLIDLLPEFYPISEVVGLVETSIGKMVPIMSDEELRNDPLIIFAEPYNNLILDKHGFKGTIPEVKGLAPKENMKAWVDRKAFIHNLGHATAAYLGYFYYPNSNFIYEVLSDKNVLDTTRHTMLQAAEILLNYYPKDFTHEDLEEHIDDLLSRFQNQALKDSVFRIGRDLARKLSIDDRFAGIIQMAQGKNLKYNYVLRAMAYGLFFRKMNDEGKLDPQDEFFVKVLNSQGIENVMVSLCGFQKNLHKIILDELKEEHMKLQQKKPKTLNEV